MVSMQVRPDGHFEPLALTPNGRCALERELLHLRDEQLPALVGLLSDARDDAAARSEDAGLLELQEEQLRVERRVLELERLLDGAGEVVPSTDGRAALGSRLEIEEDGERDVFQLVAPYEADPIEGRISVASPVGQAVLGRTNGAEVAVHLPGGDRLLRIVSVS